MSTPLPRPNPFDVTNQFASHCAYINCLGLEDRHAAVTKSGNLTVLICARFLGYMLVEAPSDAGRDNIASEIIRCANDEALQTLAELYKNHFIRCCESKHRFTCAFLCLPDTTFPLVLSTKGRTPVPTHHPSPPSFEANKEEYKVLLAVTPKSHSEAKKRVRLSNFPTFSN